jgi:hypothetical protein
MKWVDVLIVLGMNIHDDDGQKMGKTFPFACSSVPYGHFIICAVLYYVLLSVSLIFISFSRYADMNERMKSLYPKIWSDQRALKKE